MPTMLCIVFLPIDAAAVAIFGALDAALLAPSDMAIGARPCFLVVDMRFAAFKVASFAIGE